MIYFQVQDRTIRNFLNDFMPRFPFPVAAGETPPGLTDALIFYDPLVKPTRPGHILPAKLVSFLEEDNPREAEKLLISLILEAASLANVEHDDEIEMLEIEEEEHRVRIRQIDERRKTLKKLCENLSAATRVMRDWKPAEPPAGDSAPSAESVAAAAPVPADAESAPAADPQTAFYSQLTARIQTIMERNTGTFSADDIDESFRLTIDLGLSSPVPAADVRRALSMGPTAALTGGNSRVWHISDWLARKFSEIYQLPKIKEIEQALTAVRASLEELKGRLARLQQKRRDVFYSVGLNLDKDLDRLTRAQHRYFEMDGRRRKGSFSLEDKSRFEALRDEIDEIEKKIDSEFYLRFSTSPEFLSTFRRLSQAIVQSLQELSGIQEDERDKQDVLAKLTDFYRHTTPKERSLKLEEEFGPLRQFSKLLADRGRRRPFAPVAPPPWPVTASAVLSALDRIAAQDTTLFPEKFLRRRGPPCVLLLPSFGMGLYDWQGGLLVIPLYPDNLMSAVLTALAEFRMDADESRDLFNSYGSLKRNKNFGFVKLKEMFIADYTVWIEKEAAGYRVMEKDIRAWFARKIPLQNVDKASR